MEFLTYLLRIFLSIIVLFFLSKIAGSRQIAQLTFYEYIVGISVGSIAAEMSVNDEASIPYSVFAMCAYIGFSVLLSFLSSKSIKIRRFCTGKPTVMIYKGKIVEKNLKKYRYDINDLLLECRVKGYFNIEDIEYAVMETSGEISFLPKANKRPVTPDDMILPVKSEGLEYNLIIDGNIMERNLKSYGKDEMWLKDKLKEQNTTQKNVLLAVGKDDDTIQIFLKNHKFDKEIFI